MAGRGMPGMHKTRRGMEGYLSNSLPLTVNSATSSGDTSSAVPARVAISLAKTRAHVVFAITWEEQGKKRKWVGGARSLHSFMIFTFVRCRVHIVFLFSQKP